MNEGQRDRHACHLPPPSRLKIFHSSIQGIPQSSKVDRRASYLSMSVVICPCVLYVLFDKIMCSRECPRNLPRLAIRRRALLS